MIPLIVHSHYSLMWGTASPRQLCRAARQMGYERLALTDTDNLYGLWPFLAACRREGITPIVGAEVTDPGSRRRAVCLVETDEGYRNLCRLLTRRHFQTAEFDLKADLPAHAAGLTVLTVHSDMLDAWRAAGVAVVAAMPRRALPATHPLRATARRLRVPVVAVPGSFFLHPEDIAVHRILRAIARNTCLSRLEAADTAPPDAWLAPPEEYERRFLPCPETLVAAAAVAERLTFTGPAFGTVMPPLQGHDARAAAKRLREDAYSGARRRYGEELSEAVVERLEHELALIDADGLFRLLSDRARHRGVEPAHLRPRLGGGLARRLLPGHHQCLPGQAQPLLRTLSQPRPQGPARHRRGLRLGRARRRPRNSA